MPSVVLELRPSTIVIEKTLVQLEMGGGPYHYGLVVVFDPTVHCLRTKQLKDQLWYYAQDHDVPKK